MKQRTPSSQSKSSDFLFIVGRGRSGTTLLAKMLNQHSDIYVPHEGLFIINLRTKYKRKRFNKVEDYIPFLQDLYLDIRMSRWFNDPNDLYEALRQTLPRSFTEVCKVVYRASGHTLMNKGKSIWIGDKNPHYTLCLDELHESFPDAKFIGISRSPSTNVSSFKKVPFDLNNDTGLAIRWALFNRQLMQFKKEYPEKCYLIKFEDLVRDSKSELQKLCTYLGVRFQHEMLFPKALPNEKQQPWHKGIGKALDQRKAEVSSAESLLVFDMVEEVAEELGYSQHQSDKSSKSLLQKVQAFQGMSVTIVERVVDRIPYGWRVRLKNRYLIKSKAFQVDELQKYERFKTWRPSI